MKIIFCDIDGVLNSPSFIRKNGGNASLIEKRRVDNLKKIMDATGAVVVIVSNANWILGERFNKDRIDTIISYGVTPLDSITDSMARCKLDAIDKWLERNNLVGTRFIAIDNEEDNYWTRSLGDHLILVKGKNGLTPKYVRMAIEVLKKETI